MVLMALFFGSLYFIPSFLLIFTPHKWVWLFLALLALLVSPYNRFLDDLTNPKVLTIILIVLLPAILAKIAAIIARKNNKRILARLLVLLGLLGPGLLLTNFSSFERYFKKTPASQTCQSNGFRPKVGNMFFHIPASNHIQFRQNKSDKYFNLSVLGSLCKETNEGRDPFDAINITIYPPTGQERGKICNSDLDNWQTIVCAFPQEPDLLRVANYIVAIYPTGSIEGKKIGGMIERSYDQTYEYYLEKKHAEAEAKDTKNGLHELKLRRTEYIWIDPENKWKTQTGTPYATECFDFDKRPIGRCLTTYALNDKVTLRYSFPASKEDVGRQAKRIDSLIQQMINQWQEKNED